jgi:hypothetical protein
MSNWGVCFDLRRLFCQNEHSQALSGKKILAMIRSKELMLPKPKQKL